MSYPPPLEQEEEQLLLAKSQKGDRKAYGRLVEAYRDRAFAGAISILQNHDDARDLTQDAFVRAFKNLHRFKLGRPFYPWYYRIMRNLCLNFLERHGPSRKVSLDRLIEEHHIQFQVQEEKDVRQQIHHDQMAGHLRREIEALKPEFREIIAMKHFQEMSYQEIADALRIPIGTVMSRLYHARKALAQRMEPYRE